MATPYIDRTDTLESEEVGGVIRSLTRVARVVGLTDTDYSMLWSALTAAGIPSVPSTLDGVGFEMLVLTRRHARIHDGDTSTADVTLNYNHFLDGDNQEISGTSAIGNADYTNPGVLYGRVRCSIQQIETGLYYDWTKPGNPVNQITVSYTYPQTSPRYKGRTITQGGSITVPVPMQNFKFGGYIYTSSPGSLAAQIAGTVNLYTWWGQPPRTWLCQEVNWEIVTGVGYPARYKFNFEFQNNPDTWDPSVLFIDEQTNRPPPDLIAGVGFKQIQYIRPCDYSLYFLEAFAGQATTINLNPDNNEGNQDVGGGNA